MAAERGAREKQRPMNGGGKFHQSEKSGEKSDLKEEEGRGSRCMVKGTRE